MTTITGTLNAYLTQYSTVRPEDFKDPSPTLLGKLHFCTAAHIPADWTLAGEATVTVTLVDRDTLVGNKVDSLRAELAKVKADAYRASMILEDKINKLLAITYETEAA